MMIDRIKRRVMFSRPFRRLIGWARKVVLPGFEGFSLFEISRFFVRALTKGHLIIRASAISFKLFLAFFPAVIVLLTLIPYIPIPDFQERLLGAFAEMLPSEVFKFIENTLHDLVVKKHGTLLSVSFLVGVYLASNSIDAILEGFSGSTNIDKWHSALTQRLLSLGLLLVLSLLTVIAIPLLAFGGSAISRITSLGLVTDGIEVYALLAVKWLVSILLVLTVVALLYNAGDPTSSKFRFITPGALLAVFLILVVSQALAYVFSNITDYNALYGSIGAILAVQLWIYMNMIVLLVGFELNSSIARARVMRSEHLIVR